MSDLATRVWVLVAASFFLLIGLAVVGSQPTCTDDGLDVLLPVTPGASVVGDRPEVLRLTLKANGATFVQHSWCVGPEQIRAALAKEREAHPGRPLVVNADRRLPYERVRAAIGIARDAGFHALFLGGSGDSATLLLSS